MPTQAQFFLHKFRNSWKWILAIIIIAPLLKWSFLAPMDARFGSFASSARALGQVTGIVGTLLFSFSMILSYRNRITETLFGGLDTLYRIHHKAGMYGLFIMLLHPLLLSIPLLLYSVEDAMTFFIPFQTSSISPTDFGILSLLGFILLIGITLFGVIFSYPALKKFHMFLGVAFLLGAIHGFLIPSDIQHDMFIRIWVLGFAFLGLFCYLLFTLLKKLTVRKKLYRVTSVKMIEGGITEIFMTPEGKSIEHLPGQFGFFSFVNSKVVSSEPHPFTISSWENNGNLIISAKALGDFTSLLPGEQVGTLVKVEGPYGEFSYGYSGMKQVWVAGGVGVTPFVAFAEHILKQKQFFYDIDFFYSIKTKNDIAFNELFSRVAVMFPSFRYHPMPSDTDGFITGQLLAEKVPGIIAKDIFICGPPPMMNALISSLQSFGVTPSHIHSELFSLLK